MTEEEKSSSVDETQIKADKSPEGDTQMNADDTKVILTDKEEKNKKEIIIKEEVNQSDEGDEVKVPKEFKKLVEEVEKMSVLQLHELVKVLEKKFDVSAQAVAVAGPAAEAVEEKSEFTVDLKSFGESKIGVIKAVKATLGLGLKEAKDLVEAAPTTLKEKVAKDEAEAMKTAIEEAGGTVELK